MSDDGSDSNSCCGFPLSMTMLFSGQLAGLRRPVHAAELGMGGTPIRQRGMRAVVLLAIVAASLLTPSGARGATVIADHGGRISQVSAYRDVVVWTTDFGGNPTLLFVREDGRTRQIRRLPGQSVSSVSTGPDGRGGARVVFTVDGGMFTVDPGAITPRRLAVDTKYDESDLAVWGSRVAFFRQRGLRAEIRVGRINREDSKRGPTGPIGDNTGPERLALHGKTLAFSWRGSLGSCSNDDPNDRFAEIDGQRQEIYVGRTDARAARLIATGCLVDPVRGVSLLGWLTPRRLAVLTYLATGSRVRVFTPAGHRVRSLISPAVVAVDDDTAYAVRRDAPKKLVRRPLG